MALRDTFTTAPLTWMELDARATGISSAWAFPVLSVASATIPPGLVTAPPTYGLARPHCGALEGLVQG